MERQTITVDIAPGSGPIQRIRLSQGDIGRQLGVYIIQNGAAVDCSGYSAHLYVLKPDGNYYERTCSISSNLITWTTAAQETPLAGECKAQIRITASGQDIGTANFIEAIEATPAAGGTASESLISSMTQYVDAAESAARTAVAAEDTVEGIISTYSGIPGRVTKAENSLAAAEDGLAIVANGNTHAAIASGQFVYVKNHGSLAEGLYVANSAIATNAALTTSNLTADGSGGLNALKAKIGNVGNTDLQSQVTSLNSNLSKLEYYTNVGTVTTLDGLKNALLGVVNGMIATESVLVRFYVDASLDKFKRYGSYIGYLVCNSKSPDVIFTLNVTSQDADNVSIGYNSSDGIMKVQNLNSDISNIIPCYVYPSSSGENNVINIDMTAYPNGLYMIAGLATVLFVRKQSDTTLTKLTPAIYISNFPDSSTISGLTISNFYVGQWYARPKLYRIMG